MSFYTNTPECKDYLVERLIYFGFQIAGSLVIVLSNGIIRVKFIIQVNHWQTFQIFKTSRF